MKQAVRFSILLGIVFFTGSVAAADPLEEARAGRWKDLRQAIFGDRVVMPAEGAISLEAPDRALDGARVPVTLRLRDPGRAKGVYLIIDENPMPLAAHVSFGPASDPRILSLPVRLDRYTYVHAVVETDQGALLETARFVKASGGCSGPPPADDAKTGATLGQMRLTVAPDAASTPAPAPGIELSITHPNCTGMQIDPVTRAYEPARYLERTEISRDGNLVLRLETGFSLAADPTIAFRLSGPVEGELAVVARDSDGAIFEQTFDLARQGS